MLTNVISTKDADSDTSSVFKHLERSKLLVSLVN